MKELIIKDSIDVLFVKSTGDLKTVSHSFVHAAILELELKEETKPKSDTPTPMFPLLKLRLILTLKLILIFIFILKKNFLINERVEILVCGCDLFPG